MDEISGKEMYELGNTQLVKFMVARTDAMISERFKLIKAQEGYLKAKEDIEVRSAYLVREVRDAPDSKQKASNPETRKAELVINQSKDKMYQELIKSRNECWHVLQTEEAIIERIHNELLNVRAALAA